VESDTKQERTQGIALTRTPLGEESLRLWDSSVQEVRGLCVEKTYERDPSPETQVAQAHEYGLTLRGVERVLDVNRE
jgi:hypothetical protein